MRFVRTLAAVCAAVATTALCTLPAQRVNAAPAATTHARGPKRYPTVRARFATRPTASAFDCAPCKTRGTERCPFTHPGPGEYYVMVETVTGVTRGSLTAKYRLR